MIFFIDFTCQVVNVEYITSDHNLENGPKDRNVGK